VWRRLRGINPFVGLPLALPRAGTGRSAQHDARGRRRSCARCRRPRVRRLLTDVARPHPRGALWAAVQDTRGADGCRKSRRSARRHGDEPTCGLPSPGQKGGGSSSGSVGGGWFAFADPLVADGGAAGGGRMPGGGRRPGGRVVRVIPDGVVTCRVPSGSRANRQPLAKVFSRWWLRHRQQSIGCASQARVQR
jgi:hypothetical protein